MSEPALPPTRPRLAPSRAARGGRRVWIARGVSFALHAGVIALLIVHLPGLVGGVPAPDKQPEVELVMVEQKGARQPTPPTPPSPSPAPAQPRPPSPPAPPLPAPPPPLPPAPSPPAPARATAPSAPVPARPPPPEKPAPARKTPPAKPARPTPPSHTAKAAPPHPQMQMNLGGNNPETNTIVTGDQVIPASPDAAYHNRQPVYPLAAAERGEHGAVMVLIHVAPDGHASAVDVLHSSGYPALDQAAVSAVRTWHFLPAVRDGQPVASSFPFRVVFQLDYAPGR